ncbi:MAG: flagellar filament capping protein FliD [Pseudomonadales bacterium]|nr:flagellar filament capping protein FliD [Pseudomonadales bacterium]
MIITSGLGSGLDINGIVEGLVEAEGAAKLARLDRSEVTLQAKLSSFGTLKSALSSFGDAASTLAQLSTFRANTVETSDFGLLRAKAGVNAVPGSYSVDVSNLASAHSLASAPDLFTDKSDAVGTGTLHIAFGTTEYDPGTDYVTADDTYTSFTANAELTAFDITINSANNSLTGLRDAINDKDAGVQASIINDGSGYRLMLSSESGVTQSMEVTVTDDDTNNDDLLGLSRFSFNGTQTHMEQTQAGIDAGFKINGLAATSSSNDVSSVVEGVTLTLIKADPGNPATVTVSRDDAAVEDAINGFVSDYNDLIANLRSVTSFNAETGEAGILLGDYTVRNITQRLSRELLSVNDLDQGGFRVLAEIGITTSRSGDLTLDNTIFSAALASDFDSVVGLFAAQATATDSNVSFVASSASTQEGSYALNITNMADASGNVVGTLGGADAEGAGSLLTGSGLAQGLTVNVSGGTTGNRGTVTFTRGLADRVNAFVGELLSSGGAISTRTEGLSDQIGILGEDRVKLNSRLLSLEDRLRRQYTALDSLISGINSTGNFLSAQLESLPPIGRSNN